jgi:uncharacterized protein (DUF885 family)
MLATALQAQAPANIDDFFRDFTAQWVRGDANLATRNRYFTGDEQDRLERQLTPETKAYRLERIRLARQGLAGLAKFDRAKMADAQRVSADVMRWQLDTIVREEPFLDFTFPIESHGGANVRLVEAITVVHPVRSEKDALNYLAALGQVGQRMDQAIAESGDQATDGIVPPDFILAVTIKQMQSFVDGNPAQNPFVTAFSQKLAAISSLPAARREELRAEAEKITASQIYPVWKKAIVQLESQQKLATPEAGLSRFKNGPAAYAKTLHRFTTTDLSAEQIHQIGLDQVQKIEGQMDTLLRRLGRTEGSVKDRVAKLKADMGYPEPTSQASRELIMQDIETILRDAEVRSALMFDARPKSPVIAQPFPSFREANAAAQYSAPAPDGSRPGTFQFPRRPEEMTRFGLRSTVYHETVPGHHFQIALEVEDKDLPRFRQIRAFGNVPAFSEGWGLYAERLAAESGWYGDDIEGLLGQLDYELFRARRLVVDTGLHAKHWTRQQAIDHGIEASEVERYVVNPGQACSYMIGELKIVELRERARKALGDRFSLREFHNVVLKTGSVPLEILERQVDAWIRSQGGKV